MEFASSYLMSPPCNYDIGWGTIKGIEPLFALLGSEVRKSTFLLPSLYVSNKPHVIKTREVIKTNRAFSGALLVYTQRGK
jgi:hypothetical protein